MREILQHENEYCDELSKLAMSIWNIHVIIKPEINRMDYVTIWVKIVSEEKTIWSYWIYKSGYPEKNMSNIIIRLLAQII